MIKLARKDRDHLVILHKALKAQAAQSGTSMRLAHKGERARTQH